MSYDGVNYYENHTKSIEQLGRINNLLSIEEIMLSSITKSKNNFYLLIDKNILIESTLFEYLSIFNKILINNPENLNESNNKNIFSKLDLFFSFIFNSVILLLM